MASLRFGPSGELLHPGPVCNVCNDTMRFVSNSCPFCEIFEPRSPCHEHIIHTPRTTSSTCFAITLDLSTNSRLGVALSRGSENKPWRIASINGGLVGSWNDDHPEEEVKVGDYVLSVNGISDETNLAQECEETLELTLQLSREPPEECPCNVSPSGFPISVMYEDGGLLGMPGASAQLTHEKTSRSYLRTLINKREAVVEACASSKTNAANACTSEQDAPTPVPSLLHVRLNKGLGFVKERVEGTLTVPVQISEKAQSHLLHAKEKAKVASTVVSVQMSQMAKSGVKMAKRLGKAGGA